MKNVDRIIGFRRKEDPFETVSGWEGHPDF